MKVPLQDGTFIDFIDFPQEIHPGRLFAAEHARGNRILDIGCGNHKTLEEAVGIDIRPITDIQASAEDLSLIRDESVDCIISRHSFEHMLDPVQVLREWMRVLRPGGRIVFVLPDHSKVQTMSYPCSMETHMHAYTPASFQNLLSLFPELSVELVQTVIENWSFGCVVVKR